MKRIISLSLGFLALQAGMSAEELSPKNEYNPAHTAAEWIPLFGEKWWDHYHPDYKAWYPGGRSDRYHDTWIAKVNRVHLRTTDWRIFNRDYAYDGQWFAVEWFYRATDKADGFQQWESTLGFGRIEEGRIILWAEYFDNGVGELQRIGLLPLYEAAEPHAPWPARARISLPYRP